MKAKGCLKRSLIFLGVIIGIIVLVAVIGITSENNANNSSDGSPTVDTLTWDTLY